MTGGFVPKARRGIKLDGYAHFADILATFSTLAGYDPTDYKAKEATKKGNPNNLPYNADATTPQTQTLSIPPIDSLDLWPYLMGEEASSPRTGWLQSDKTAIKGDYKIIFGNGGSIEKVFEPGSPLAKVMPASGLMKFDTVNDTGYGMGAIRTTFQSGRNCSHGCLFNIQTDPTELYDISGSGYSQDTRGGCIGTTKDTCDPTWVNIPAAGAPAAEPAVHKEMTKFYNGACTCNSCVTNYLEC
jgi:arylsulfatase I/J